MALPQNFIPEQSGTNKYTLSGLKSGEKVKVRVLSDFITGKSVWGDKDGKRIITRRKIGEPIPTGLIGWNQMTGKPERIKQFVAAIVWNYSTEQVEILETDKATIIGQIFDIEANEDWGDSKGFDLTISRSGEGMETKYSILPSNQKAFKCPEDWSGVNLNALFDGTDPFASNEDVEYSSDEVADEAYEALN
jgi:hypothetical protein